jgi:hypothetical protein
LPPTGCAASGAGDRYRGVAGRFTDASLPDEYDADAAQAGLAACVSGFRALSTEDVTDFPVNRG